MVSEGGTNVLLEVSSVIVVPVVTSQREDFQNCMSEETFSEKKSEGCISLMPQGFYWQVGDTLVSQ